MSIVEVAKLAGVSHATVSRVINSHSNVSPSSVRRVEEAMSKLRYVPAANRRGPKPKTSGIRTGSVGLLFVGEAPTLATSPVMARVLHAVQDELAARGLNLMVGQINAAVGLPPNIANGRVDGLLMHGTAPSPEIKHELSRYPACVWLLSQRSSQGYWGSRVSPDNYQIGQLAAKHLIGLGHREVAVVHPDPSHLGFIARVQGFQATAQAEGIACPTLVDPDGRLLDFEHLTQDDRQVNRVIDQLLAPGTPRCTGLFVPRDALTVRFYRLLRMRGIEPGTDIEIVSCDNVPVLDGLYPRPATIDVRPVEIGRRAVEQLLGDITGRRPPTNVTSLVEPALVAGDLSEVIPRSIPDAAATG